MKKSLLTISLLSAVLVSSYAEKIKDPKEKEKLAAEAKAKEEKSKVESAEEEKRPLTLSGYVDTYYFANFSGAQSNLGASGFERIFDQKANNFQLGLAQMKTTYETGKVTGVIDLTFGNHGDLGNYGNSQSPLGAGIGTSGLAIKQAYITWKMSERFSLTGGQYGTNVGYEVIDAPVNFNYSLSNMFGNGPFYHTGIKLDIAASDKIGFMVGVVNGLDSKDDNNKAKGIQSQISIMPNENWSVYLNYFGSDEGSNGADGKYEKNQYNWFDLTTSYQVTEKLFVGVNAVVGNNNIGNWSDAALYLNGRIGKKFDLGTRFETFNNKDGGIYLVDANGDGVSTNSFTLTGNYKVSDNLVFKPEYRFDSYKNAKGTNQIYDKDGGLTKNSQSTLGAALIFYF